MSRYFDPIRDRRIVPTDEDRRARREAFLRAEYAPLVMSVVGPDGEPATDTAKLLAESGADAPCCPFGTDWTDFAPVVLALVAAQSADSGELPSGDDVHGAASMVVNADDGRGAEIAEHVRTFAVPFGATELAAFARKALRESRWEDEGEIIERCDVCGYLACTVHRETADTLNDRLEADHVVQVTANGDVADFPEAHAPEAYWSDGALVPLEGGWEPLRNYSRQQGGSPDGVMHDSEYVGGSMAQDMLSTPGVYVVVVVSDLDDDGCTAVGWMLLRRDA